MPRVRIQVADRVITGRAAICGVEYRRMKRPGDRGRSRIIGVIIACVCIKAGKSKCPWRKEAEAHGIPPSRHNCQWRSCS